MFTPGDPRSVDECIRNTSWRLRLCLQQRKGTKQTPQSILAAATHNLNDLKEKKKFRGRCGVPRKHSSWIGN
ncbi:hypothetical protein MY8738_007834 [Beauveria namnaoensis]